MHRTTLPPALLLALVFGILPAPTKAQPLSALVKLHEARLALTHYQPEQLPDIVADLTSVLRPGVGHQLQREARWLRAAATVDAWTIATDEQLDLLNARLANAYHTSPARLREMVRADLLFLSTSDFSESANAALLRLQMLEDVETPRRPDGSVHDTLLWLEEIVADLASHDSSVAALAPHAERLRERRELDEPYMQSLDDEGQRAVQTLEAAVHAHQRFARWLEDGSPLASALRTRFEQAWEAIRSTSIRPGYTIDLEVMEGVRAASISSPGDVSMIFALSSSELSWSLPPHLGIDDDLRVTPRDRSWPTYPEMHRVPIAQPRPAAAVALEPLEAQLRQLTSAPGQWYLAVNPNVSGLLFAQALLAAENANQPEIQILGRNASGEMSAVRVAVADAPALPAEADVRLRVHRLGFRLASAWGAAQVPNVRINGAQSHDHRALSRILAPFHIRSAIVRFHGNLTSEAVLGTLWDIAPDSAPVILVPERRATH